MERAKDLLCSANLTVTEVCMLVGRSPEAAEQLRALVASGAMGVGVLATDDCRQTYKELSAKGVTFLSEPAEPTGSRRRCVTTRAT